MTLIYKLYYNGTILSENIKERIKALEENDNVVKMMKEENILFNDKLSRSKEMMEVLKSAANRQIKVIQDPSECIII